MAFETTTWYENTLQQNNNTFNTYNKYNTSDNYGLKRK